MTQPSRMKQLDSDSLIFGIWGIFPRGRCVQPVSAYDMQREDVEMYSIHYRHPQLFFSLAYTRWKAIAVAIDTSCVVTKYSCFYIPTDGFVCKYVPVRMCVRGTAVDRAVKM